jgi:CBS domain containing-hemolysin-like protein
MTEAAIMIGWLLAAILLVPLSFLHFLYLQALRLRVRDTPALETFKEVLEPRIGLKLDEGAIVYSVAKHALLCGLAILSYSVLQHPYKINLPDFSLSILVAESLGLSIVLMLALVHILPMVLYRKTTGEWLIPVVPLLRAMAWASAPLLLLLRVMRTIADLSSREEPQEEQDESNQIAALITAGKQEGLFAEEDRKLIQSVVEFGDKTVREVMTPRNDVVAIDEDAPLEELRELAVRERYSRILVFSGTIDNVTGFVHVRDLFELDPGQRKNRKVRSIRRAIKLVPETKPADAVLRLMQRIGDHMVVVIDEYGNTAGLATLEDLVEEIVGEIRDEHEPGQDISPGGDGSYVVSGNLDLDRLHELVGFRPSEETESTTIGGLVTEWMGHVPAKGESAERDGLRIEVLASSDRRVSQVRLSRQDKAAAG